MKREHLDALDHADAGHQEIAQALTEAINQEKAADPQLCTHCMAVGMSVAKIASLRWMAKHAEAGERAELEQALSEAQGERLAIGSHGASRPAS